MLPIGPKVNNLRFDEPRLRTIYWTNFSIGITCLVRTSFQRWIINNLCLSSTNSQEYTNFSPSCRFCEPTFRSTQEPNCTKSQPDFATDDIFNCHCGLFVCFSFLFFEKTAYFVSFWRIRQFHHKNWKLSLLCNFSSNSKSWYFSWLSTSNKNENMSVVKPIRRV